MPLRAQSTRRRFGVLQSCKLLQKNAVATVGGGITGVTIAYALSRRGFSVTLFERHR